MGKNVMALFAALGVVFVTLIVGTMFGGMAASVFLGTALGIWIGLIHFG